jgi:hypothetical protein
MNVLEVDIVLACFKNEYGSVEILSEAPRNDTTSSSTTTPRQ